VSPSGAANYSIPIVVPPGTNGMAPSISLNYNSQGGNGLVGMGWAIGGLSVIHRCGATITIDGFKGGVNYDANDRFCLDGERLISIGNNEYRTQHESWQKIVFFGTNATDPASFTVRSKDGTVRYYGATTDSRIEAAPLNGQTRTVARVWALNKIQDVSGNYLAITYQENNAIGEYYPVSIAYTGNGSVAPYNFVFFDYPVPSRSDVMQAYEGGSLISTTKLLTGIHTCTDSACTQGSTLVRKYVLGYANNGAAGRSRLASVQECGSDGVCLPATTLGWQDGGSGYTNTSFPGFDRGYETDGYVDVDGDGKDDFVYVYSSGADVYRSNGSGFGPGQNWYGYGYGDSDSGFMPRFADLNGDGRKDYVFVSSGGTHYVSLSTGGGFGGFNKQAWTGPGLSDSGAYFVDLNGDGRADYVSVSMGGVHYVGISTGTGYTISQWSGCGWIDGQSRFADLDGDGRMDFVTVNANGTHCVSLSRGDHYETAQWSGQGISTSGVKFADLNGDGRADYLTVDTAGNHYVSLSTGAGYVNQVWSGYGCPYEQYCTVADFNGDGKADFLYAACSGQQGELVTHYLSFSTGSGYINQQWTGHGTCYRSGTPDINGDGKADFVGTTVLANHNISFSVSPYPDLLTSITNGLTATTTITYKPLSDSSVHSSCSGGSYAYPYKPLCDATYVVSGYTQSNGIGGVNSTSYMFYTGMLWNHEAATRTGFATTWVKDATGIIYTFFNRALDGTEGTVTKVNAWDSNGQRIKDVSNTWQSSPLGAGRTSVLLTTSNELNYVLGTTTNTAYSEGVRSFV
jgi:hypothetical protein